MNIFIRTLFWQILKAMIPSEDQDDLDVCIEINAGVGGQEAMLFCLEIFNMYLSYADFMGWDADVTSYETTDLGMSLPMVYCLHVLAVIIISLFRQNTYLQNKKHTLTCQGGTGCYRFNYQPGSSLGGVGDTPPPPPPAPRLCCHSLLNHRRGKTSLLLW